MVKTYHRPIYRIPTLIDSTANTMAHSTKTHNKTKFTKRVYTTKTICIYIDRLDNLTQSSWTTASTLLKIYESTEYISSLAMVHYIFMNPYGTKRFKLIRERLRTTIRTPQNYTWWRNTHNHVVYAKVAKHIRHMYIGMSIVGIHKRELSRKRKTKQVINQKLVSCEPAIRYWIATRTNNFFIPVVIAIHESRTSTLASEASFIARWTQSLNMPHIQRYLKGTTNRTNKNIHNATEQIPCISKPVVAESPQTIQNSSTAMATQTTKPNQH
jgi:hypothetical protein